MDVMEPGAAISRELAGGAGEGADAQIDAFISPRHERRVKSEGERATEDLWRASSRAQEARRREELDEAWCSWHLARAEGYAARAREHEAEAEKYRDHRHEGDAA